MSDTNNQDKLGATAKEIKWTLRYRFWRTLHGFFNRLAHKYADPGGEEWGKALRIDHTKLLWRLNSYCGNKYIPWWVEQKTGMNPSRDKEQVND